MARPTTGANDRAGGPRPLAGPGGPVLDGPGLRLLVASDVRALVGDETVLATHPAGRYEMFAPLLGAFDEVTVISRRATGGRTRMAPAGPMTGAGVAHLGVPDYADPAGMLRGLASTTRTVWRAVGEHDAALVRLPEPLSILVGALARLRLRPVVVNLVADPLTLPVPGPGPMGRVLLHAATRAVLRRSAGIVYVTSHRLQSRLPPPPGTPTLARSNVRLTAVRAAARTAPPPGRIRMLCVGTTSGLGKGQDLLVEALRCLVAAGCDATLTLVGGGGGLPVLRERIRRYGLEDRCVLTGHLGDPGALQEQLDAADVFCLPSRSEGLPRAMVEAMAAGVPGIGSDAGGIPELLPPERVLSPPTAEGLAAAVRSLCEDPDAYAAASRQDLATARRIHEASSPARMVEFLTAVLPAPAQAVRSSAGGAPPDSESTRPARARGACPAAACHHRP